MRDHFRLWWLCIPIFNTLNQVSMKLVAMQLGGLPFGVQWLKEAVTSPYVIIILVCEICSFIAWMKILAVIDVSKAVPLTGFTYVFILLLSWSVFHESITWFQLAGSALILIGVWLIGTIESHPKT